MDINSLYQLHTKHADSLKLLVKQEGLTPVFNPSIRKTCPFKVSIRTLINGRYVRLFVPCGHCLYCKEHQTSDWHTRFTSESTVSSQVFFVTLTYNNQYVEPINSRTVQLFLKRLRRLGLSFRYALLAEYGPKTHRPHYHCLFFLRHPETTFTRSSFERFLLRAWRFGFVTVDPPSKGRYKYIAKYCNKLFVDTPCFRRFSLKPGIGKETNFIKLMEEHFLNTGEFYVQTDVGKLLVPKCARPTSNRPLDELLPSDFSPDTAALENYLAQYLSAYEHFRDRKL